MAYGGIAILALVFALALTLFEIAREFATVTISILTQHLDTSAGDDPFAFTIAGTEIHYGTTLTYAIALALLVATLYASWRLARPSVRACPECRSTIPEQASVCRYCSSELGEVRADA